MKGLRTFALLALLALASSQAAATGMRPLQLGFSPPSARATAAIPARPERMPQSTPRRAELNPAFRHGPVAEPAGTAQLRQRAVQSLLSQPEPTAVEEPRPSGRLQLKFQRRGDAMRDFRRSYNDMCTRVSQRVWDEPNGKRIRFDIAGKPGVAVEIPLR
jgi:hypothetical protein